MRSHLKNVYATLTMSIMAASAGAYVHLFTDILKVKRSHNQSIAKLKKKGCNTWKHYQGGGLIFSLLGAGIALGLFMTPDNGKNRGTRLSMLMAFAFLTGLGLGPLLSMAIMVNPSLVPSAFMLTSAIFACFTGAALFAPDGKYLYLGGTLLSGLSTLLFLGFLNIFFRSQLLFQVSLQRQISEANNLSEGFQIRGQ